MSAQRGDVSQETDSTAEVGYTDWLRARLHRTIMALDSGQMKSYPSEVAKTVLLARLELRRKKLNLSL